MLIIYILFSVFSSLGFQQEEEALTWNAHDQIEWSDFKAPPREKADVIAVTASGISFEYSTTKYSDGTMDYTYDVKAHFYPEKSWYLKDLVTANTLSHERLHFDITELYARKFRKRIAQTNFTSRIDDEMAAIYKAINMELSEFQNKYDAQTHHSQDMEIQRRWERLVATELEKLAYYRE